MLGCFEQIGTVEQFVPNCGLAPLTRPRTAYAGASRARMPPENFTGNLQAT